MSLTTCLRSFFIRTRTSRVLQIMFIARKELVLLEFSVLCLLRQNIQSCRCSEPSREVWGALLNRSEAKLEIILNVKRRSILIESFTTDTQGLGRCIREWW